MVPPGDLRVGNVRVCTLGVWFRVERHLRRWRAERTSARVSRQTGSLYGQFVAAGDLCFDIGANVGARTAVLNALGARVVAVEPQHGCAELLRDRFGSSVEVVEAAVGAAPGTADLLVPAAHTLATLSPEWAEAVRESGRFAEHRWENVERVDVVTLDDLISRYGRPTFVKIDVEGYELEALRGLSTPIDVLSLEFDFEFLESRLACVDRLASLGMSRFNFSEGETMALVFAEWVDSEAISRYLQDTPRDVEFFGDIYASA